MLVMSRPGVDQAKFVGNREYLGLRAIAVAGTSPFFYPCVIINKAKKYDKVIK